MEILDIIGEELIRRHRVVAIQNEVAHIENAPHSAAEIYSEITILHMRGITTEKGYRMVDDFLKNIREKHIGY